MFKDNDEKVDFYTDLSAFATMILVYVSDQEFGVKRYYFIEHVSTGCHGSDEASSKYASTRLVYRFFFPFLFAVCIIPPPLLFGI